MNTEANYSIKDLEKLSGIKAHTLRIWEKRYSIFTPQRTDTNIRMYSNEELRKILNISLLNKNGFKISSIASMVPNEVAQLVASINLVKTENEDLIDSFILSMIDLDEPFFDKTFNSCIIKMGFESTIQDIIFPFLSRIGTMWQSGSINPAQEHFVSNIIRQKMIVAIDGIKSSSIQKQMQTFVLFLRENELHEMVILFYNYALRSRGYRTIYLGQSVPVIDLERVVHIIRPDFILTVATNPFSPKEWKEFKSNIDLLSTKTSIYLTGKPLQEFEIQTNKNIHFFKSLPELIKLVSR
ncbi:MAG: MerR family transcriptional regulator [Bacteroidia bacterium]|nr:MerR family transcriptional regulator [Bacteroidia bacterium]